LRVAMDLRRRRDVEGGVIRRARLLVGLGRRFQLVVCDRYEPATEQPSPVPLSYASRAAGVKVRNRAERAVPGNLDQLDGRHRAAG
jgi:hypothetical protein